MPSTGYTCAVNLLQPHPSVSAMYRRQFSGGVHGSAPPCALNSLPCTSTLGARIEMLQRRWAAISGSRTSAMAMWPRSSLILSDFGASLTPLVWFWMIKPHTQSFGKMTATIVTLPTLLTSFSSRTQQQHSSRAWSGASGLQGKWRSSAGSCNWTVSGAMIDCREGDGQMLISVLSAWETWRPQCIWCGKAPSPRKFGVE